MCARTTEQVDRAKRNPCARTRSISCGLYSATALVN